MKNSPKVEKDGSLASLFNDDKYQSDSEKYEKSLSSLTSALETLRTEGELSKDATKELIEQFPELASKIDDTGRITEDLLSNAMADELANWVKLIKDAMKEASPEE
jgi:2-oxo-4-hydroxy-4-carboxy--5-ureidoimidazoline (OHCU) decarboxylase